MSVSDAPTFWLTDYYKLPKVYDSRYRVIAVDASSQSSILWFIISFNHKIFLSFILDIKLRFEGLDNFILLDSLQELYLSKNKLLDDFSCDKIARIFRNSKNLSVLDLSDNPLITNRGIETLHRIESLKKLIITGTKAANYPFIELSILLFNDINPNCKIIF